MTEFEWTKTSPLIEKELVKIGGVANAHVSETKSLADFTESAPASNTIEDEE